MAEAPGPGVPDDATIAPGDFIYRRVRDGDGINVVVKQGQRIASSAAFEDDEDGISVFLHSTLVTAGLAPLAVIEGHSGYVLAQLSVSAIRDLGVGIVRDPNPADAKPMACNVAHCLLKLAPMSDKQNHKLRQALARQASLLAGNS